MCMAAAHGQQCAYMHTCVCAVQRARYCQCVQGYDKEWAVGRQG